MKIGNFDSRVGKSIVSVVLVGTIAACIASAPKLLNLNNNDASRNIYRGYYTDEDVKKNKADIMNGISEGNNKQVKTYAKKKKEI